MARSGRLFPRKLSNPPIRVDNRVKYSFLGNMNLSIHRTFPRSEPAVSRLDVHVGYWLRRVSNQFSHALNRQLQDKGVTLVEWIVLRELYDGDLMPSALAERLGMTRSAISKLAGKLANSLMITQQSAGDGRAQILSLTGGGRAMVCVLATLLDETDQEFFGHLEPDTRALILSIMRDIVSRDIGRRRGLPTAPVD
jgi:DNA-binding MarR family transcriptional regulator